MILNLKRKLDIVVISNVYLGTNACHAKKLLNYLNSIEPKHIILNGAFIGNNQKTKNNYPKSHLKVLKKIESFYTNGVKVTHISKNDHNSFRNVMPLYHKNISIVNKLLLDLDGKKTWIFNSNEMEVFNQFSFWLIKFGNLGYEILIIVNRLLFKYFRKSRLSNYSSISKNSLRFEDSVTDFAISKGYHYIICSHTQLPKIVLKTTKKGNTTYLNSGDWVKNFTALEYRLKRWKLYQYSKDKLLPFNPDDTLKNMEYNDLIAAFTIFENTKEEVKRL